MTAIAVRPATAGLMTFYLGTHMPNWLGKLDVPLFVSNRTLYKRKSFPRALAPWCLDSGGFSELNLYDEWRTTPAQYIALARTYMQEIGNIVWAAPQDWMCEPFMLTKTGLTVAQHQQRTVENFVQLREEAPDVPFIPVLQGWELDDYQRCVEKYDAAGVDLALEPTVGLGSVCRRQHTGQIEEIVGAMYGLGIQMHGFGVKTLGLRKYGPMLQSADSMAWSFDARYNPPIAGHTHKNCANCPDYALAWRDRLLAKLTTQGGVPTP